MADIKIPFALNSSQILVCIKDAQPGSPYYCPSCNKPVIVRKGNIRVHHFSHKADSACNQETAIHKLAKLLIRNRFQAWLAGSEDSPVMLRYCRVCGSKMILSFPETLSNVSIEERLADGFIADVLLCEQQKPIAAIEVRVSHAVDEHKTSGLTIPFIEVKGSTILEECSRFEPLVDTFPPIVCQACKDRLPRYLKKAGEVAAATGLTLPERYFRYKVAVCWHCEHEILLFAYPGHEDDSSPDRPVPSVLRQFPFKRGGGHYWSNVCPYCKNHQGVPSTFVAVKDELYFGEIGPDTDDDFAFDQMKFAYEWEQQTQH